MGYAHRFYFKQELPKVSDIKEKFQEITGLRLRFFSKTYPDELMTDTGDLLHYLEKCHKETNIVMIHCPRFTCDGFDDLWLGDYMRPESRSFYIQGWIGTKSMYFFLALIKTMHEIGGSTFNYSHYPHEEDLEIDKYLDSYRPHEREWKRIRKWDEMCDVEKAAFRNKYSE